MFGTLFVKEIKEKFMIFAFGLAVLGVFLLVFLTQPGKRDILEWLTYALLLAFFPAMGLLIGSSGFESEFRSGAWGYLFSRPVKKPAIWLTKYAALVSMLLVLWAVLFLLRLLVPQIGAMVSGARTPITFATAVSFPFLSFISSLYLLTLSFSLSILLERQISILFVSAVIGPGLSLLLFDVMNGAAGGYLVRTSTERAVATLVVGQVLTALAFAGASVLTLLKVDMTQRTKKIKRFAGIAVAFLLLAAAATAAWAVFSPAFERQYLSYLSTYRGEPYFSTDRGIFKYSETKGRIQWLIKSRNFDFFRGYIGYGKLAFMTYSISVRGNVHYVSEELWTMNTDGTGRRRIQGSGDDWKRLTSEFGFSDCMLSPDGKDVIITTHLGAAKPRAGESPFWLMHIDGTGLKNLPLDVRLSGGIADGGWLRFLSWSPDGGVVLVHQIKGGRRDISRIWAYDLKKESCQILLEGSGWPLSLSEGFLAMRGQVSPDGGTGMVLLNLKTLEVTDIALEARAVYPRMALSRKGDRLVILADKRAGQGAGPFAIEVYSLAGKSVTAEKTLAMNEHAAILSWPNWLADDAGIIFNDRNEKCLRILDPGLKEKKRISYPAGLKDPVSFQIAGDIIIVEDFAFDTLWRLDLRTSSWKRIY